MAHGSMSPARARTPGPRLMPEDDSRNESIYRAFRMPVIDQAQADNRKYRPTALGHIAYIEAPDWWTRTVNFFVPPGTERKTAPRPIPPRNLRGSVQSTTASGFGQRTTNIGRRRARPAVRRV